MDCRNHDNMGDYLDYEDALSGHAASMEDHIFQTSNISDRDDISSTTTEEDDIHNANTKKGRWEVAPPSAPFPKTEMAISATIGGTSGM